MIAANARTRRHVPLLTGVHHFRYPTFCRLAGVAASDASSVPPLPIDPADPSKDLYGNTSWPDIDGVDVSSLLLDPSVDGFGTNNFAAHPQLWLTGQVLLQNSSKLLVGQGFVGDSGEKTPGKDGWRYPNGTWITAADVGWKCGLAYKPTDPYIPCLFNESDIREMTDLAPTNPALITSLWAELNRTNLGVYASRSPANLLGPCAPKCAAKYWKSLGGSGDGPICGVPGCTAE